MQQITNYPDYYITEDGTILSNRRKNKKFYKLKTGPLSKKLPYLCVSLQNENGQKTHSVHRLVAEHFIPNPNNLPYVCHKDDNPMNPHKDNLFWGTQADNMKDMYLKKRSSYGSNNGQSKLTDADVLNIRSFEYEYGLFSRLGKKFKISAVMVSNIYYRKAWTHI